MANNVRYLIGVKRVNDGKWLYATEVSNNARFVNADCAKKFINIEFAKKWWDWSKNYFDDYHLRRDYLDWESLSVVKYIVKEDVAEKL